MAFPIVVRAGERGPGLPAALRAVRRVDRWVTIPAYFLAALTGVALAAWESIPFSAFWIWGSILLFVALMALGFGPYRPLSRQRLALAPRGADDPEYRRTSRRIDLVDAAILASALAMATLMALRP